MKPACMYICLLSAYENVSRYNPMVVEISHKNCRCACLTRYECVIFNVNGLGVSVIVVDSISAIILNSIAANGYIVAAS